MYSIVVKFIVFSTLCLLIVPAGATPTSERVQQLREHITNKHSDHVIVIAHRACWQEAPENSLAAIKRCIDAGVDMVELDVRATADGQLVLIHDATLERTTNGVGRVDAHTYAAISSLRLRSGRGDTDDAVLTEQGIPTLAEALAVTKGKILVNIDAKAGLHEAIFRVVTEMDTEDQVLIKMRVAPDDPAVVQTNFVSKALFMPIIVECKPNKADSRFCVQRLDGLIQDYTALSPVAFEIVFTNPAFLFDGMSQMREAGRVWVNTLKPEFSAGMSDAAALADPERIWGHLVDSGVSMIQTDYPVRLINFLKATGRR